MRMFFMALAVLAFVSPAAAANEKAVALAIEINNDLNDLCRGNSGDEPTTWDFCAARDKTTALLYLMGYCHGTRQQASFEQKWHRCGPDSLKPGE